MLGKRSRKKSIHRKNINLFFICLAIFVGLVGGLGTNLVHSETSQKNPVHFLENEGSMSKTSDATVEVHNKGGNGGGVATVKPKPQPTPVGNTDNDTPAVIVSDNNPINSFPQTGEAPDHLAVLGAAMLIISITVTLVSIRKRKQIN